MSSVVPIQVRHLARKIGELVAQRSRSEDFHPRTEAENEVPQLGGSPYPHREDRLTIASTMKFLRRMNHPVSQVRLGVLQQQKFDLCLGAVKQSEGSVQMFCGMVALRLGKAEPIPVTVSYEVHATDALDGKVDDVPMSPA